MSMQVEVLYKQKMPKVNIQKLFFITLWEFTISGEEQQYSIIHKTFKLFKTFKVKSLARPKLDILPKEITYNLF